MGVRLISVVLLLAASCAPARGQDSNATIMARIAVDCARRAVGAADTLALDGSGVPAFLRSALVASWLADGVALFDAPVPGATRLSATVEEAGVTYARAGRGLVARSLRLRLRLAAAGPDGAILYDDACGASPADTVAAGNLDALEDPGWPETTGTRPAGGFLHRVVRPAVIGGASAVGVFLFFSLRSRRATDG